MITCKNHNNFKMQYYTYILQNFWPFGVRVSFSDNISVEKKQTFGVN